MKMPKTVSQNSQFNKQYKAMTAENLDFVENRLVREGMSPTESAEARDEFLKFASLNLESNKEFVPSKAADEFWHTFLLFTANYQAWCNKHFGKNTFLHHVPGRTPKAAWTRTVNMIQELHDEDWSGKEMAPSCGCKGKLLEK